MSKAAKRDRLVAVTAFGTGVADAVGYLGLGGAFASVMTGNMVLLGIGAGQGDVLLLITALVAIVCFSVGVLLGAAVVQRSKSRPSEESPWPSSVNKALYLELVLLATFALLWVLDVGDIEISGVDVGDIEIQLLGLAAFALGIQSSAIQGLGVSGLSSTYLTGTLTRVISAIPMKEPWHKVRSSVEILLGLIAGASAGAVAVEVQPLLVPMLLLTPLVLVLIISRRL